MQKFKKKGYTVYNLTLPGRGVSVEKFAETTWQEWADFALEDYLLLKKIVKKVIIAGFSTGATVALKIANQMTPKDKPDGLIIMSPAIFFVTRFIPLIFQKALFKIYAKFNPFPKKLNNRHKIFRDPVPRKKYDLSPIGCSQSILELYDLSINVKKNVNNIDMPILVIQSVKDIVILPYSAKWLIKKVPSKNKKLVILKRSGHPVMVDLEKEKVYKESIDFVKRII